MSKPRNHLLDVPHPHAGRAVGVVWDMGVAMASLFMLPLMALAFAIGLGRCHWLLLPVSACLIAFGAASVLFGVLWVFRGCTFSTCWLFGGRREN